MNPLFVILVVLIAIFLAITVLIFKGNAIKKWIMKIAEKISTIFDDDLFEK